MKITFKELKQCDVSFVKRFIRYKLSHIKDDNQLFEIDYYNGLWIDVEVDSFCFDVGAFDEWDDSKLWIEFCDNLRKEKEDYYSEFS